MINRRRSGARGTPAKVNATAGLAASEGVNSASVSDGSHESVYLCPFYVLTPGTPCTSAMPSRPGVAKGWTRPIICSPMSPRWGGRISSSPANTSGRRMPTLRVSFRPQPEPTPSWPTCCADARNGGVRLKLTAGLSRLPAVGFMALCWRDLAFAGQGIRSATECRYRSVRVWR